MTSGFERFVALRYLWGAEGREEGRTFLRFITYVAIGGVALGVAALLLSLAIVRGFRQEITDKIIGFGAHIQVRSYVSGEPLSDGPALREKLSALEGVTQAAPTVEDVVLLRQSETAVDGVVLLGAEAPPSYMEDRIVEGRFRLRAAEGRSPPPLVVGAALADRLGLKVGEKVAAFSMRSGGEEERTLLRPPRIEQFVVAGIYETSLTNIDDTYAFTGLPTARKLFGMERGAVSRFDVTVQDLSNADSLAATIESRFGFPVSARTIYQIQPYASLFAWVDLQRSIIPLVIGVIVIVAAFNIIGALLMMVLEKTRAIGVLQSMGASQRRLKRLFLLVGVLIGTVGATIGSAVAFVLSFLQQRYDIVSLPADAYYMTTAPIDLQPLDYLWVNLLTVALCALAAYIPARVAARIEPVRAIRFQ